MDSGTPIRSSELCKQFGTTLTYKNGNYRTPVNPMKLPETVNEMIDSERCCGYDACLCVDLTSQTPVSFEDADILQVEDSSRDCLSSASRGMI